MKNLKRILSLALACTMLIGMMVVGANAATFSDSADIEHAEAVETLVALGVVEGNGDGNFDPNGPFTRAAMAKMLAWVMNKGKEPKFADTDEPTFTDVDTNSTRWAIPYIEYCYQLGYINGDGGKGSTFRPNDAIKSTEFARALLNAMGYKLDSFENWELKTEIQARDEDALGLEDGLYADLDILANKKLTRDEAAQMLVTAINAPMYNAKSTQNTVFRLNVDVDAVKTAENPTGKISAAERTALMGMEFDSAADADAVARSYGLNSPADFTIEKGADAPPESLGSKYLSLNYETEIIAKVEDDTKGTYTVTMDDGTVYTKVKEDYSNLMGHKVTVMYKALNDVYGMTDAASVVYDGPVGAYLNTFKAVAGTATNYINTVTIVEFNNPTGTHGKIGTGVTDLSDEWNLKVINNGNNSYRLVVTPIYVRQVDSVTDSTIALNEGVKGGSLNLTRTGTSANVVAYEGIAKDDYVLVTAAVNNVSKKTELTKAEFTTGVAADAYQTVAAVTGGTGHALKQVHIGSEWITVADPDDFTALSNLSSTATYDVILVNGVIAFQKAVSGTTVANKDMIFILKIAAVGNGLDADTYQARVITKEGKIKDIDLKTINPATSYTDGSMVGKWYQYTEKDGVYTLTTAVTTTNGTPATAVGYVKAYKNIYWDKDAKTLKAGSDALKLADDATVIFYHNNGATPAVTVTDPVTAASGTPAAIPTLEKLEVLTGKTIKSLSQNLGKNTAALNVAFTANDGGIEYVKFVFIIDNIKDLPGTTGSEKWGYVLSTPYNVKDGLTYEMWDGTDNVTVIDSVGTTATVTKGAVIQYEDLGDGKVKYVGTMGTLPNTSAVAISGYNAIDGLISFDGDNTNIYTIADDVKVLYIDSSKTAGSATGSIKRVEENKFVPGVYTKNAYVLWDGTTVKAIVMDVNNNLGKGKVDAPALQNVTGSTLPATEGAFTVSGDGATAVAGNGQLGTSGFGIDATSALKFIYFCYEVDATEATASTGIVLTITNESGTLCYRETGVKKTAANTYYSAFCPSEALGINAGQSPWQITPGLATGNYTYRIADTNGTVYLTGTFHWTKP